MNTFKELLEANVKRDLVSMAPHAPGEQNFVDQQTVNKSFSDKFLVPDNGVFDAAKNVKVYNRKGHRMGRNTAQSIAAYDKGDTKTESENLTEFWFNKDGHFRRVTKRNTKHPRHIVVNGKVVSTTSDASTNKEAIKHFLATSSEKIARSKIKVEMEVGYPVHVGLAKKDGPGFIGLVKEFNDEFVWIFIKENERTLRVNRSLCTEMSHGPSEIEQIFEAINNPNTSGQGHDEDHKNHPLHGTLEKHGYSYSHSTPIKRDHYIAAGGEFKQAPSYVAHSYFHGDADHCCSVNSDSYKWHTKTSPASGRVTSGEGAITLDRHLKGKAKRFALNNPVVDATEVNPAHNSDNAIHAGIRDDGVDAGHNDHHDNAIHASIHHDERHIGHKDDIVGENVRMASTTGFMAYKENEVIAAECVIDETGVKFWLGKEGKIIPEDKAWTKKFDERLTEEHWIQKAIKHPGALTRKAKREGVSNSEFEAEHKDDSGTTGKEARLALTLKKMHESTDSVDKDKKKDEKKDEKKSRPIFDRLMKSRGLGMRMHHEEVNEAANDTLSRFANSKGKMKEDRSKIDSKNDKVDKVKEFITKRRGK